MSEETDEQRIARYKKLKRGDWIFTCGLAPKQFNKWDDPKNPADYDESWKSKPKVEQDLFFWWDDFTTLDGSHHSSYHCSCTVVSAEYAMWFTKHVLPIAPDLWARQDDKMDYEELVAHIAQEHGIKFEGA